MLYFVPEPRLNVNAVDIAGVGLSYAFPRAVQRTPYPVGPDGSTGGVLLTRDGDYENALLIAKPDLKKQTWKNVGKYWVGYFNHLKPTEQKLRRPAMLTGDKIELANEFWQIPRVFTFDEVDGEILRSVNLNRYIDVNESGQLTYGDVEEKYREIHDVALQFLTEVYGDGVEQLNAIEAAARVIQQNYYISVPEMALLKMLTQETSMVILDAAAGHSTLLEALKKKRQRLSTSDDGSEATESDTSQP